METISVSDRIGNNAYVGQIEERISVGEADLIQVWIDECKMAISMIVYNDGSQWTPHDWCDRVMEIEDIPNTKWVRHDGMLGIMLDDLPRALE